MVLLKFDIYSGPSSGAWENEVTRWSPLCYSLGQ